MIIGAEGGAGDALVLWYVPVADLGGVARHVLDTVRTGIPGARVIVLCPEGPLARALRGLGAPVVTGDVSPADGPVRAVRSLRGTLSRLAPAILHTHLAFADLVGVAAVRGARSGSGARMRLVTTEHGISGVRGLYRTGRARARALSTAHRARLLGTDRVIAVSGSTRDQVAGQWGGAENIRVIPNAVDAPASRPVPSAGLRVLTLSRLAPEKRIDLVLESFALLHARRGDATLTIAGDGPQEQDLRAAVRAAGLEGAVFLVGHRDAPVMLAEHDVLVQLSRWENASYSLLDGVAWGLGAVATDVGGNREILPTRCLVPTPDPASVASLLEEQGLDPSRRPAPVARGVDSMTAQIGHVYQELLR